MCFFLFLRNWCFLLICRVLDGLVRLGRISGVEFRSLCEQTQKLKRKRQSLIGYETVLHSCLSLYLSLFFGSVNGLVCYFFLSHYTIIYFTSLYEYYRQK